MAQRVKGVVPDAAFGQIALVFVVKTARFNSMLLPLLANEATRKMMLDYGIVSENFLEQIRGEQQTADAEVF